MTGSAIEAAPGLQPEQCDTETRQMGEAALLEMHKKNGLTSQPIFLMHFQQGSFAHLTGFGVALLRLESRSCFNGRSCHDWRYRSSWDAAAEGPEFFSPT